MVSSENIQSLIYNTESLTLRLTKIYPDLGVETHSLLSECDLVRHNFRFFYFNKLPKNYVPGLNDHQKKKKIVFNIPPLFFQ